MQFPGFDRIFKRWQCSFQHDSRLISTIVIKILRPLNTISKFVKTC